jgi:hypothetical protein
MVQFIDSLINLALNAAGFTGLTDPHQIIIAIVIGTATVLWNSSLVPRWAMIAFFSLMGLAATIALYALLLGVRPTCIYTYDARKPVFADSATRKLGWGEVRALDCADLWVARNEVYLRANYCFVTPIAVGYFDNDASCDPSVEEPAGEAVKDNVKLIQRVERRRGCPNPIDSCRRLGKSRASQLKLARPTIGEQ